MSTKTLSWHCRQFTWDLGQKPRILGIINVTPDSFSDGGRWDRTDAAIAQGLQLAEQGADLLDIGGESTRPGATPVPLEEELRRVLPVVRELVRRAPVPISIDTMKAEVARQCLELGAAVINDVSAFRHDPGMVEVAREYQPGLILMHMQGTPQTMQIQPTYQDVVAEVAAFFAERLQTLTVQGIAEESICWDPGIGFGKTIEHNLSLLAHLGQLPGTRPLCLGVSRKGLIGTICGRGLEHRLPGSLALASFALSQGTAQLFRVHDVAETRDAVQLWNALQSVS